MKKIVITACICIILLFISSTKVNSSGNEKLVITEIMPNPIGSDTKLEWVEIYNNSGSALNLLDWSLNDKPLPEYVIPDSTFLVLVRDETEFKNMFGSSTSILKTEFSLNNAGGNVNLTSVNGDVFEFHYTESQEGKSFELYDGTCNIIEIHLESHSAGRANTSCDAPLPTEKIQNENDIDLVIINSVSPNPETGEEWLDLKNQTSKKINLDGWVLKDASDKGFTINGLTLEPYSLIKVYPSTISLNNDGDELRLFDSTGRQVDVFIYPKASKDDMFVVSTLSEVAERENDIDELTESNLVNQSVKSETITTFSNNKYFKKPIFYKEDLN